MKGKSGSLMHERTKLAADAHYEGSDVPASG
jgi:hypothetical protein